MKAESAAIFERTIQENPKVIGEQKALVESNGRIGRYPGEDVFGTLEALVSSSLTRAFSSGGGI